MAAVQAPQQRHTRILACVLCQHRKIKCDRNFPCANCLKSNATCTPSTPAPARKRRRPNQDLQERLARCEELLKQYSSGAVPPPTSQQQTPQQYQSRSRQPLKSDVKPPKSEPSTATSRSSDGQDGRKPAFIMVKDEGGDRFMDSYIWASVFEELQAMRDIVDTDEPEDASIFSADDPSPDSTADLFLPGNLSTVNVFDLQPEPVHAYKLWQLFCERVHPLTKVVHPATLQPTILEAATCITNVSSSYQALAFSIYNLAVISLTEPECAQLLGMPRDAAIQRFMAGTKAALSSSNFLKNYNMAVLQALVFHLYSLQGRYDRHAAWIFSGTVVRVAQKMGYHRDGAQHGLDPFETEMRRRIWWQITIQDSKYALLSGLQQTMLPLRWDTEMPRNVNDADLIPGSSEPIRSREGPTEMAFCLILNEFHKFRMMGEQNSDVPAFESAILGQDLDGKAEPVSNQLEALSKLRERVLGLKTRMMELETQFVDVNAGGVHKAAMAVRPMVTNKFSEMLVPLREQPEWGTEIFGPKDSLFKVLILNNEQRMEVFELLKSTPFLWFVRQHYNLDMFAVLTAQLCQRPTGKLVDRAWAVAERIYRHYDELYDVSQKQYMVQAQFTLKAWARHEQAFQQAGQPLETPQYIVRLRELVPSHQDGRSSAQSTPPGRPSSQTHLQQQRTAFSSLQQPQPQQQQQQQYHPQHQHQQQQQVQQQHLQQEQQSPSLPLPMQCQQQQQQQQQQQNGGLDPFLNDYLDISSLNWDGFGDVLGSGTDPLSAAVLGGLSYGDMAGTGNMNGNGGMGEPPLF